MSGCSCFDRITLIDNNPAMDFKPQTVGPPPPQGGVAVGMPSVPPPATAAALSRMSMPPPQHSSVMQPTGSGPGPGGGMPPMMGAAESHLAGLDTSAIPPAPLERDYYGCYCLKFIVKNGTHITEEKVQEDFGQFGEVVDVRGPGLFSGLRGNHVYVRFIDKIDAEEALRQLSVKYHQLTPASISDVLPDNYGLYTISFYNKTGIPSSEVRKEFSKFGEVKNLTGSLDVKGGRVFVSYKEKTSAVQALQAFFFRKDRYPNMKFALPRCEKDYFGCYCLKFYNKSGDVTEEKVHQDFGQFGDVVDVRGPGLFDVTGDDVYVRYKEKSSAEQALIELVGKYDSLCLAPPSDIQADKFGYFTITFVNDKCLSKSDVWYIFSKFGTVACVNGTFDCKKGRVFVSYKEKQGALNALETMLITKEYHLQVSKNSTVRKNDYNVVGTSNGKDSELNMLGMGEDMQQPPAVSMAAAAAAAAAKASSLPPPSVPAPMSGGGPTVQSLASMAAASSSSNPVIPNNSIPSGSNGLMLNSSGAPMHLSDTNGDGKNSNNVPGGNTGHVSSGSRHLRSGSNGSRSREPSLVTSGLNMGQPPPHQQQQQQQHPHAAQQQQQLNQQHLSQGAAMNGHGGGRNGLVKFNRNVERDIFGYYCLSFLNEDGDINEKKVRFDFGKFGEVVSVRGALGKQKGHVFVRFRRKEAAENCLNCLNSFPLSEMSELFGKYLFLSPATPRDIDCDMYNLYSISFLNLNMKTFREIRQEFAKFGDIVRLTSGGGGNTDELVSISYAEKNAAVKALQTHFTNKEFPYLDIAKGSSLLLVNSSDSSDNEDNESDYIHYHHRELQQQLQQQQQQQPPQQQQQQHHHRSASAGGVSSALGLNGGVGVIKPPQSMGPISAHKNKPAVNDPFHDPSSSMNAGGQGSDVVDELLKPLQSYFSIYRTGEYQSPLGDLAAGAAHLLQGPPPGHDGSNPSNPVPPFINGHHHSQSNSNSPAGSTRSPDKKYRIKAMNRNVPPPPLHMNNGGPPPPIKPNMSAPPPANGMPPPHHLNHFSVPPPAAGTALGHQQQQQQHSSNDQSMRSPLKQQQQQLHHHQQQQQQQVAAASSPASSSQVHTPMSSESSSVKSSPERESQEQQQRANGFPPSSAAELLALNLPGALEESLDLNEKKASSPVSSQEEKPQVQEDAATGKATEVSSKAEIEGRGDDDDQPIRVHADILGLFTLSFSNRLKDQSERKVRLDFEKVAFEVSGTAGSVVRVRGLAGLSKNELGSGETVSVSFSDAATCESVANNEGVRERYPGLQCAPLAAVCADRDGFFSVDFINSGMSGIREITTEFSQHGEVVKVIQAGGAKNAVKRVTVSFAAESSAFAAVKAKGNSKDFGSCYFVKECLALDEE